MLAVVIALALIGCMSLCAKQVRTSFGFANTILHATCIAAILNIPFKQENDNAETLLLIIVASSFFILLLAIFWRYARLFEHKGHQLVALLVVTLLLFGLMNRVIVPAY